MNKKVEKLENEILILRQSNESLENTIIKVKEELNSAINYSTDSKLSIFKIRELQELNFELKQIISRNEFDHKLDIKRVEGKYEIEINRFKREIELINHKYESMMRYETYINKIESVNKELNHKLENIEHDFNQGLKNEEKKYQIKLDLMKQKTLNLLGDSKKLIQANAGLNITNSHKLIGLQVKELNNQLSEQSEMLEELLKDLNKKEKIIRCLKINICVFKEMEKIFVNKNRKLSNIIKSYLENKKEVNQNEYVDVSNKFLNTLKNGETEFINDHDQDIEINKAKLKLESLMFSVKNLKITNLHQNKTENKSKSLDEKTFLNIINKNIPIKEESDMEDSEITPIKNINKLNLKGNNSSLAEDFNSTTDLGNSVFNSSIKFNNKNISKIYKQEILRKSGSKSNLIL